MARGIDVEQHRTAVYRALDFDDVAPAEVDVVPRRKLAVTLSAQPDRRQIAGRTQQLA